MSQSRPTDERVKTSTLFPVFLTFSMPEMEPDACVVASSGKISKSDPAVIGMRVNRATSVEDGSSVEVATMLIGKPFSLAPTDV